MHQFSFFGRERSFYRRPQAKINKSKQHEDPQAHDAETSGLTGTVGPGIMARFRRLFNTIRRNENSSSVPEIFQYTPSQNPEEFLENLQNQSNDQDWNRLSRYEVTSVPSDSPVPDGHTRIVCISCTHSTHRRMQVPNGDVLIHCGDFTERGFMKEIIEFNDWLGTLPHKHKIVIAGNHEISFDQTIMESLKKSENMRFRIHRNIPESIWKNWQSVLTNCIYLQDSETTINGIRIYGSPWQPNCGSLAFNLKRGNEILEKWQTIPSGIDILVTHGPPAGRLDRVNRGARAGCVDLLNEVQLRVKPKYHIFGHIHDGYGMESDGHTVYINCSTVDALRNPQHPAVIFDFPNLETDVMKPDRKTSVISES